MSLKFQSSRSYNSNDWTLKKEQSTGRVTLLANSKGVRMRTTLIISCLATGEKTIGELLTHLQELHPSYTMADVRQPLKKLDLAGLLRINGKAPGLKYSLHKNAKAQWKRVTSK